MVPPGQVPGLSDSTLQVRLGATEAGWFSGEVSVNSNDPDRPLFTLNLSGRVLSPDHDSDLDGMNDAAELALSALGFLWNSSQAALVTTFYENVGLVGFHAEREIMDLQWKASPPLMTASGNTIWLPLEMTAPSAPSTPWLSPGNVLQTAGQALDVSVLLPAGKRFVRLKRP